jgi:hypothetical protein
MSRRLVTTRRMNSVGRRSLRCIARTLSARRATRRPATGCGRRGSTRPVRCSVSLRRGRAVRHGRRRRRSSLPVNPPSRRDRTYGIAVTGVRLPIGGGLTRSRDHPGDQDQHVDRDPIGDRRQREHRRQTHFASLKKTDGDPNGAIAVHRSPRARQRLATEPASWSRIGLDPAHWNAARI